MKAWLEKDYPAIAERAKAEGGEIHWGDETALTNTHGGGRSYAPKEGTPVALAPGTRQKLSMISTVTNQGKAHWMIIDGNFNADQLKSGRASERRHEARYRRQGSSSDEIEIEGRRDREAAAGDPNRIRFTPAILPPYARRSKSLEMLIPILYLKGISTGDFEEALAALLGKDAPGLSASTVARLKEGWTGEHERWQKRDLSARCYVYVWADGVYLQARLEDEKQCILVIIGATSEGKKELIGFTDGARESAHDWRELLLGLKRRGLTMAPELAVADGGLGFWKALGEVWPTTREQRCWVHKTANVLNKLPKSQHPKAKRALQDIWMAETRNDAEASFDSFIETYELKYEKAAACLKRDRDALLAYYDFPAEHWKHLRTSNPIESTFATVRHRTIRSKGCLSNKTALAMVFKLVEGVRKAGAGSTAITSCQRSSKV